MKVLGVSGAMAQGSDTLQILQEALVGAKDAGAEVQLLDLSTVDPPNLRVGDKAQRASAPVQRILTTAAWADAYIIATPEYHGGPSGALKNWFDHLYPEPAGKVAGIIATAGGNSAVQSSEQLETYLRMLHCWTLPYLAQAVRGDFDPEGHLTNDRVIDRLRRVGRDVATYGKLIRDQHTADVARGEGVEAGYAAWHRPKA